MDGIRRMQDVTLIQLVMTLPPALSGVGDYSLHVARALSNKWKIHSHFIVCDPAWDGPDEVDGFPVTRLTTRKADVFADTLSATCRAGVAGPPAGMRKVTLLHLSPYGYERNGCPFWLAQGLRDWKKGNVPGSYMVITMFHELYAMSPPWRKAFWVSAFQRKVLGDIHAITDVSMTNLAKYAAYLNRQRLGTVEADAVLNTPSTVGEPHHPPPLAARAARLAIFGSRKSRQEIYRSESKALARFVREYGIEEIVDIGVGLGKFRTPDLGCPVRARGILSAEEVSNELARCAMGVVWYPPEYLGKSAIYAAYCAHGLVPLIAGSWRGYKHSKDGVEEGKHFLYLDRIASEENGQLIESVAEDAHRRYRGHDVSRHAAYVASVVAVGSSPLANLKFPRVDAAANIPTAFPNEAGPST